MSISKQDLIKQFVAKFAYLHPQGSPGWHIARKHGVGGSEICAAIGWDIFKTQRDLIESKLGLSTFSGNINTYWGTILEDYTVKILEKFWGCKIYETGSLPGAVPGQNYSPDGITYVPFLDKIVLLEIKNASRRVADGRVPRNYKPQVFTGLDTVLIAELAIFVDVTLRRCKVSDFNFTPTYDTQVMHSKKPLGDPMALCMVGIYQEMFDDEYKKMNNIGECGMESLEYFLGHTAGKRMSPYFSSLILEDQDKNHFQTLSDEFDFFCRENNFTRMTVLPLKLFKFETVIVERDEWKKVYNRRTRKWEIPENNREDLQNDLLGEILDDEGVNEENRVVIAPPKSFVEKHSAEIAHIVDTVKKLEHLSPEEQIAELNKMYPPPYAIDEDTTTDLIDSLLKSD